MSILKIGIPTPSLSQNSVFRPVEPTSTVGNQHSLASSPANLLALSHLSISDEGPPPKECGAFEVFPKLFIELWLKTWNFAQETRIAKVPFDKAAPPFLAFPHHFK